jgi:hypothetical protein
MALQHAIVSPEAVNTEVEGVFDRPLGFEGGRAAGGGAAVPEGDGKRLGESGGVTWGVGGFC